MIPMSQVTTGAEMVWEDSVVHRRDRFPTLTVHADARMALVRPLLVALALMVIIVVCLFNSIRTPLLVWLIVPLAIIGVTAGL